MDKSNLKMATIILLISVGVTAPIVSGLIVWRSLAGRLEPRQESAVEINKVRIIRAEDITPYIPPGKIGIPFALPGWQELAKGKRDGEHDPSAAPGKSGCYGLAWNVNGYRNIVFVFQDKRELKFDLGGWYVLVQVPDGIQISAADVGRIQADWIAKTYGGSWTVLVISPDDRLDGLIPRGLGR